ncbi:MAG TPA: hypothetical protein EYP56_03895 [Planctomycetaceae bacterium]|nr:hypothetical protein [Planctomycetaceae bacterium]HIQ21292.1 hypothetical protein [Planctomycetota bacterium]
MRHVLEGIRYAEHDLLRAKCVSLLAAGEARLRFGVRPLQVLLFKRVAGGDGEKRGTIIPPQRGTTNEPLPGPVTRKRAKMNQAETGGCPIRRPQGDDVPSG